MRVTAIVIAAFPAAVLAFLALPIHNNQDEQQDARAAAKRVAETTGPLTAEQQGTPTSTPVACVWGKYTPVAYTVTVDLSTTRLVVGQQLRVHLSSNIGMPSFTLQVGQPAGRPSDTRPARAILQAVTSRATADGQVQKSRSPDFVLKAVHPGKVILHAVASGEIRERLPDGCAYFNWGSASGKSSPIVVTAASAHR